MWKKWISKIQLLFKYLRRGGVTHIHVAQIHYGGVLKGKVALVTGGSSGIGLAIAKKYLSEGAKVLITGRNSQKLEEVFKELNHPNLNTLVWDLAKVDEMPGKLNEAIRLVGDNFDILVNNAGVHVPESYVCKCQRHVFHVPDNGQTFPGKKDEGENTEHRFERRIFRCTRTLQDV